MAQLDLSKLQRPIIASPAPVAANAKTAVQDGTVPFLSVLQRHLEAGSNTAFSKHAVSRVAERQVDVSEANLERLNQGMQLAQEKGLREALILIDQDAYIVNAAAGKVITVDTEASGGSVFTNIDGTVII